MGIVTVVLWDFFQSKILPKTMKNLLIRGFEIDHIGSNVVVVKFCYMTNR